MRAIYGFVYLIRNRVSGKVYIGQTTRKSISARWSSHKSDARSTRSRTIVSNALRGYGFDAFQIVELGRAYSADELNSMERRAIWSHSSDDRDYGYNEEKGGNGDQMSVETRARRRAARLLRRPHDEETRAKIAATLRGQKHTPTRCARIRAGKQNISAETRAKISAAQLGRKHSEETRARMREAAKNVPAEVHARRAAARVGSKLSAEHIAKVVAANTGKKRTPEQRERIAAAHRGKKQSPEAVAKRTAAIKGRKRTEEQRALIATRTKEWWAARKENSKFKGHERSEEYRAKMRAAWVRRKTRKAEAAA